MRRGRLTPRVAVTFCQGLALSPASFAFFGHQIASPVLMSVSLAKMPSKFWIFDILFQKKGKNPSRALPALALPASPASSQSPSSPCMKLGPLTFPRLRLRLNPSPAVCLELHCYSFSGWDSGPVPHSLMSTSSSLRNTFNPCLSTRKRQSLTPLYSSVVFLNSLSGFWGSLRSSYLYLDIVISTVIWLTPLTLRGCISRTLPSHIQHPARCLEKWLPLQTKVKH